MRPTKAQQAATQHLASLGYAPTQPPELPPTVTPGEARIIMPNKLAEENKQRTTAVTETNHVLDRILKWLATYIKPAQETDLHILTLWIAHTHVVNETYTTPRLLLDSPVPGSGKTTALDHIQRLAFSPVQAASLSSPALLARLVAKEPRTILIDEAEKILHPKAEGVGEFLAVINSGYRKGSTRPVSVQKKINDVTEWQPVEMSTYGAVAMAGNSPHLPEDTKQRCIKVMLLPDLQGSVKDSDWQYIEEDALKLGSELAAWAKQVSERIANDRPDYPQGLIGRNRERWSPLLKVARAATSRWEQRCTQLIECDLHDQEEDRKAGLNKVPRHVQLVQDIQKSWPDNTPFWSTTDLLTGIKRTSPQMWSLEHRYGDLTAQALGKMLVNNFRIRASRPTSGTRTRGYYKDDFAQAWASLGKPDELD